MSEQGAPQVRICRECGRPVAEGMDFCGWCGAYCTGPEPSAAVDGGEEPRQDPFGGFRPPVGGPEIMQTVAKGIHQITILMLSVWVVMSLVEGLPMVLAPDYIAEYLAEVYSVAPGYTEDMVADGILIDGTILVASGLLALISAALCRKLRMWKAAMLSCVLSAMVMFGPVVLYSDYSSVLYVMCGIIVSLRIKQARGLFKDRRRPPKCYRRA